METFTGRKPTDEMFSGGESLRQWVNGAFPASILQVMDAGLLENEDSMEECLCSVIELGLLCSKESPQERISMKDVTVKLKKIKLELNATTSIA